MLLLQVVFYSFFRTYYVTLFSYVMLPVHGGWSFLGGDFIFLLTSTHAEYFGGCGN